MKHVILFLIVFLVSVQAEAKISNESVSLLEKLVAINSGTQNIEGLEKVRQLLIPEFEKLGYKTRVIEGEKKHKVVQFKVPESKPELLLMGHIDTVFTKDSPRQKLEQKEGRYYGPGVIDMKGGIVLILDVLKSLTPELRKRVTVILNDDEEIGSPHTKEKYLALLSGIQGALVFEPALPGGVLVTSHSGVHWLKLSVEGKASHAGLEPEKGTSSCVELGFKISKIHNLSDYDKKLSVNPGTIQGGTKPNVVCEKAETKIDIRYVAQSDLDETLKQIDAIAQKNHLTLFNSSFPPKGQTEFIVNLPSMPPVRTKTLFAIAEKVGQKNGVPVKGKHVGYASDANHLASKNIDLLVGLGPYGGGMHSDEEFLDPISYSKQQKLAVDVIRDYLK